ncbi:hypothetical protein HOF56_04330 [Candidatus Peribacteria bacterium]|nr:hypothetical protein [Candidatus Peribacteria bacterium]MBT4241158.1 hypothetical protein [Candidatus Peribacteria bacterium]
MISSKILKNLYQGNGKSMKEISDHLDCSVHKVQYWMNEHKIKRRSISDAIYLQNHPNGDPFKFVPPKTKEDHYLFGLGLGLYWGEGTKSCKYAIRLGNTDPDLIIKFMEFLIRFFDVKKSDFKFGLQIFTDLDVNKVLNFWTKKLDVHHNQFGKPIITISGSIGTYRKKSEHGVVTVHYNNVKLRKLFDKFLPP